MNECPVSQKELNRQFRVLRQMLSIHSSLRDRYALLALIVDILLIASSVVFCATTFARDDLFTKLGLSTKDVRHILGIASIAAFFSSLVALRVDWKGKSAQHRGAVQKLTLALKLFRKLRKSEGRWPENKGNELGEAYWEANSNIIEVPSRKFVRLKAKYLRKVEISKMLHSMPGYPLFVLRCILIYRHIIKSRGKVGTNEREPMDEPRSEEVL